MENNTAPARVWPLWTKLLFRFFALFFLLNSLPFPLGELPVVGEKIYEWWGAIWDPLTDAAGRAFFGIDQLSHEQTGSGDGMAAWIFLAISAFLSLFGAVLWSLFARNQFSDDRSHDLFRTYFRYYLAVTMFSYGFIKVFHLQMSAPSPFRLMNTFGQTSPMGLLWTFIGASKSYSQFAGWSEVVGGALLLFRRTTLVGSLVTFAVMLHVAALNFFYDVPVKIYSSLLCGMAVFLAAPDLKRLWRFFFLHETVEKRPIQPFFERKWLRRTGWAAKAALIGFLLWSNVAPNLEYDPADDRPPFWGVWDVEKVEKNGLIVPPLAMDSTYWRKFLVGRKGAATVRMANDSARAWVFKPDSLLQNASARPRTDTSFTANLTIEKRGDSLLILSGLWRADTMRWTLRRFDERRFPLVSRGFHWVNEVPFNR